MIFLSGQQIIKNSLGQPGGIATLDDGGKVELTQAPPSLINSYFDSSEADSGNIQTVLTGMSAASKGDIVGFSVLGVSYILKQNPFSTFSNWTELKTTAANTQKLNGKTEGQLSVASAAASDNGNFAGMVKMYGGASAPAGWLICDGAVVSRTTYAGLFAAIGTAFGSGDGSATFNLPDYRGVFPRGAGTTNRTEGKDAAGNYYNGGSNGQYKTDQGQGHHHGPLSATNFIGGGSGTNAGIQTGGSSYNLHVTSTGPVNDGTNGDPRIGSETASASLSINFIIKT